MISNNITKRILIVILFFFIFSSRADVSGDSERKQIIVIFRFDDYSSRSSTDIEVKLIDAFQKYGISCTFGVIPYICTGDSRDTHPQDVIPLTPTKANILRNAIKAGVLEVALHGYSHQTIRKCAYRRCTEFSGLDYNDQVKKIAKGKNYLEEVLGIRITTFIPPWDSYDLNTIKALENLGFKNLCAGPNGDAKESSFLKFLPATCKPIKLRDAVKAARRLPDPQPIIVVLFHQFDFLEINRENGSLRYQDFEELLAWVTSQKDIRVLSIDQAAKVVDDLSASRFINFRSYFIAASFLPPFLRPFPSEVYLSSKTAYNYNIKTRMFVLFFYLAVFVISIIIAFFAGTIMFPRSELVTSISKYGGIALLVLLSVYALRNLSLSYRDAIVIVVLLGVSIGVWSSFLKLKKQGRLKHGR